MSMVSYCESVTNYQTTHHRTQRKYMKKLLLTLLAMHISLGAQVGPQPLFIQNITISPNGCPATGTPTANISVTATGGTPDSKGQYTYNLATLGGTAVTGSPQTGVTANFTDVATGLDDTSTSYNLTVTDSSNSGSPVEYEVTFTESGTKSVSMTITSLPLGSGPGCITLLVTNPAGNTTGTGEVHFAIFPSTEDEPASTPITKEPFQQTFSAFPTPGSTELTAEVTVIGDCPHDFSDFKINFPFPQGLSNALKAYVFNKYCSCTLQSGTVKVVTPTAA